MCRKDAYVQVEFIVILSMWFGVAADFLGNLFYCAMQKLDSIILILRVTPWLVTDDGNRAEQIWWWQRTECRGVECSGHVAVL